MLLKTPRFYSPGADKAILPEALGESRFRRVLGSLTQKRLACELSGYDAALDITGHPATANEEAPFLMEWRDPAAEEAKKLSRKTVRVVESLTYWSRHVDLAIRGELGVLIFAPWFTQSEINAVFRSAMIARHEGEAGEDGLEYASKVLKTLADLSSDELLLAALGLEYQVAKWSALDWLDGMQNLPAKTRKHYAQQFARHVRFLPSTRKFHKLAPIWHQAANPGGFPTWQFKAITQFIDQQKLA